jgi:NAD+ synthetase
MRIYNPQPTNALLPELRRALQVLRQRRGFSVARYIEAKVIVLNEYLRRSSLDACVIGVSGGVDSAVVLGLAARAKAQLDSPIKRIVAAMLPIFDPGATNQTDAKARGLKVVQAFGIEPVVIDLTSAHAALKNSVDEALVVSGESWASGQLVSYVRTPALYYITSLLTQQGNAGVLLGTTNRDEGSYLGYIGKASDAMVDVQVISDLHKSEVYSVAQALGVPKNVMEVTPAGDVFDGRSDEEMFGAPYDFVQLYLLSKDLADENEWDAISSGWSRDAREHFAFLAHNLEELHRYNAHKYFGKSPAVHLDVMQSSTPGGWNNSPYLLQKDPPLDTAKINGLFELNRNLVSSLNRAPDPEIFNDPILDLGNSAMILRHVFSPQEIESLREDILCRNWIPVAVNGTKNDFDPDTDTIGSWRATAYDPVFARTLWNRIGRHVGNPRIMNAYTPTDWDGTRVWRAVGVSPLLRFIRYEQGGLLVPHYDGPFIYHEGKRTLVSVIVYIDSGVKGTGATRFIKDPQSNLPVSERNLDDWTRCAFEEEVLSKVSPDPGTCLVFDHRLLHDSEAYSGSTDKVILRTDIIFERCGTVPSHA